MRDRLLDHLVGACQHRRRDVETKRFRGLEVDHKLLFGIAFLRCGCEGQPAMADFYAILASAVSSLPHNDAEARQELYAHARTIVIKQLRGRVLAPETKRQQTALEMAILRVEAEARSKTTAKSLATILQVLQSDETRIGESETSDRLPMNLVQTPLVSAPPTPIEIPDQQQANVAAELGGVPYWLGTLLLGVAYMAAAMAFTGVIYIRAVLWVHQGVIGYPMLLVVMAVTIGLFIAPPVAIYRNRSNLATSGFLLRFIYAASRRTVSRRSRAAGLA